MNPDLIVELGTNTGAGALHFRHGSPTTKITTIDITKTSPHRCTLIEQANIEYIIKDSVEAASQVDDKIDIIFYDANHEYSNVMAEAAAWMPKMKEGGIALFDDIHYDIEKRKEGQTYISEYNKLLKQGEATGMYRAWTEIIEKYGKEAFEVKELHPSVSFGVILF
jgi:predicted O-methyltransferase YrrM